MFGEWVCFQKATKHVSDRNYSKEMVIKMRESEEANAREVTNRKKPMITNGIFTQLL